MLQLLKVKKEGSDHLVFTWNDGFMTTITLKSLRQECPCAECQGESVLFESVPPQKPEIITSEMATVKSMEIVGNYSLQPVWGDGHQTGLYTWEYLRKITTPVEQSSCQGGSCQCNHHDH